MHQHCRHPGIVPLLAAFHNLTHAHIVFEEAGNDLEGTLISC